MPLSRLLQRAGLICVTRDSLVVSVAHQMRVRSSRQSKCSHFYAPWMEVKGPAGMLTGSTRSSSGHHSHKGLKVRPGQMSLADCPPRRQQRPFQNMQMLPDPQHSGPLNFRYNHDIIAMMHRLELSQVRLIIQVVKRIHLADFDLEASLSRVRVLLCLCRDKTAPCQPGQRNMGLVRRRRRCPTFHWEPMAKHLPHGCQTTWAVQARSRVHRALATSGQNNIPMPDPRASSGQMNMHPALDRYYAKLFSCMLV